MNPPNPLKRLSTNYLYPSARSLGRVWACLGLGLTLGLAPLVLAQDPRILVEPDDVVVSVGADVRFALSATASSPLWLQWYHTDGTTETAVMGTNILNRTSQALNLTQVQLTGAGGYYAVITNELGSVTSRVAQLIVDPTFIKITSGAIATDLEASHQANWADYDGDGHLDLFVANAAYEATYILNSLYRNNGDGTFTRDTTSLPAIEPGPAAEWGAGFWNGLWVDYDNDGDLDLHVLGAGELADRFYRNDGQGVFTRVEPAFVIPRSQGENATWFDFDNDGWLDVFIPRNNGNDLFYRGLPGGRFQAMNVQDAGSVVAFSSYLYGLPFDYDDDGWTDLLVVPFSWGTPGLQCSLHRNEGHGLFRRVTEGPLANQQATFTGGRLSLPALGDFDNDGDLDVIVVNGQDGYRARLYRNDGDGTFTDMAAAAGVDRPLNASSAYFIDYDNDGHLDLFVLCRDYFGDLLGLGSQNVLFRNRGDGTFESVEIGSPLRDGHRVSIAAWADYDNDGFLDLFVSVGNAALEVNLLYRNDLQARDNPNRWLKVRLRGQASNSMGVGAKIRAEARIGGTVVRQLRPMMPAMSLTDQAFIAHFGLGDAEQVDLLRIEWPSGIVQELTDLEPNQMLTVVETQNVPTTQLPQVTDVSTADGLRLVVECPTEPMAGVRCVLEASDDLVRWTKVQVRANETGTMEFTDPHAADHPSRFYRVVVP
jgi:hypothetical protein